MGCGGACADLVEDAGLGMEGKKVRVSEVATLLPESLKDPTALERNDWRSRKGCRGGSEAVSPSLRAWKRPVRRSVLGGVRALGDYRTGSDPGSPVSAEWQ